MVLAPIDETFRAIESALSPAEVSLRRARSPSELLKHLETRGADLVVCPARLDSMSTEQMVRLIEDVDSTVPIILIGETLDQTARERALTAGVAAVVESIDDELLDEVTAVSTRVRIRQELRRHRTLGQVVRDLGRPLFEATSVEEIETLIHEKLTAHELYQFVWIGASGESGKIEIHVPIESTVEMGDLPGFDDDDGSPALQRAIEHRSIEVVDCGSFTRTSAAIQSSPESRSSGHKRQPGVTAAIVPFAGEESVLGVAILATDRVDGIDAAERSVLETLGSLVGTAMWLVDARGDLERAQRRVEEFSGVVAHEIRNPLAIAMTQLQLIREGENGDALDRIESSLSRIDRQVSNLMTLAMGLDREAITERPLAESASEAWEELETPGAELVLESSGSIRADHELLVQLFENLFRNAIEQVEAAKVVVRVGLTDGGFYVSDNGPGIPQDQRDLVFEWGYSETTGLGIGLTVVREICRVHGWTIQVTDSSTGGARFEILTSDGATEPSDGDRLAELFSRSEEGSTD